MEEVLISANRREIIGKHSKKLRREGKLPAVMYGHQIEPIPIVLDYRDASRILSSIGLSQLLTMDLEGEMVLPYFNYGFRSYISRIFFHDQTPKKTSSGLDRDRSAIPWNLWIFKTGPFSS